MRHMLRPRGYILVFVLLILLVLSIIAAALYVQAEDLRAMNVSSTYQQVAAANADRGMQEAVRAIRNGEIALSSLVGFCTGGDFRANCPVGSYVEPWGVSADGGIVIGDNGSVAADGGLLAAPAGGGLQYSYVVFHIDPGVVANQPINRYTIVSTGYAGMKETSTMMVTSVVEMEIEVGQTGFRCVNAYDCNGT